jgi:hypothetical protein
MKNQKMRTTISIRLAFAAFFLSACAGEAPRDNQAWNPSIEEIATPAMEGGEPNLHIAGDGRAYLSWIEYLDDTTNALMLSTLIDDRWTTPRPVASGSNWFVNWADFPSTAAFSSGRSLAAHWLAKSAEGVYDYDVHVAISTDEGENWSPSFLLHTDGIQAEHGFVTMIPLPEDLMFAVWLDGRHTKSGEGGGHDHGHGGAMTLRTATFNREGQLSEEAELDGRVCDCCQTAAALTSNGPVVAYRDRSDEEIRDIAIVRKLNGQWTKPKLVFEDNWQIAGCPVNGPAIAATGQKVVVAWFSAPDDMPEVKASFSENGGESFSAPVRIDDGNPIGRVDVVLLNENEALVSWMEFTGEVAEIRAVRVGPDGKKGSHITISAANAARSSGFPVLAATQEKILIAWTQADSTTTVRTAMLTGF